MIPAEQALVAAEQVVSTLPKIVQRTRHDRGESLRVAATKIGCNYQTLYKFERGGDIKTPLLLALLSYCKEKG